MTERIPHYDEELGDLYLHENEIALATMNAARVLRTTRNAVLGTVDDEGYAHLTQIGGVYFGPDGSAAFWSSPRSRHAQHIRARGTASLKVLDTNSDIHHLSMERMSARQLPEEEVGQHLENVNAARWDKGITPRPIKEFVPYNSRSPRCLYVLEPGILTVPVSAHYEDGEWAKDAFSVVSPQVLTACVARLDNE